ncbi:MAG: hypothetical protein U0174_00160 [Polyangiaceae bacterium]
MGAAASALVFQGCVAFVNADTPSDHCGFAGSETACGACLRDHCQTSIDKCCSDDECLDNEYAFDEPYMKLVDACASGDRAVCASLVKADKYAYVPAAKIVSACIAQSCSSVCAASATPHRSCEDTDVGTCVCTDEDAASSGGACSKASIGGTDALCVRGKDGCTCAKVSCSGGTSCTCETNGESGGFIECQRSTSKDAQCCLSQPSNKGGFRCRCADSYSSCDSQSLEVSSCTEDVVLKALGNLVVEKCDN